MANHKKVHLQNKSNNCSANICCTAVVCRVVVVQFVHRLDVTSWLFASLTFTERLFYSNYHALIISARSPLAICLLGMKAKLILTLDCVLVACREIYTVIVQPLYYSMYKLSCRVKGYRAFNYTTSYIPSREFGYVVSHKVGNLATIKSPFKVFCKLKVML